MDKNSSLSWKDFVFLQKLGKGSFGDVHLIKRAKDDKFLALKSVNMERLTPTQKNCALNEVRLLASIQTPYVVSYEGSFFSPITNSLCLLMEYCEEGDLQKIIKRQLVIQKAKKQAGLKEEFIWKTLIDILKGLIILHKHKIAHRDLKSANIFYSEGIAKLGDLNVSCVSDANFYKTKTGTPYYTAPQIWKGQSYTKNCDIWSLGCILYQMCALHPPFMANNFPDLFLKIARGDYDPLPELYSKQLRTLIRLCLEVDPQQRISASDLLESQLLYSIKNKLDRPYKIEGEVHLIDKIKCPKFLKYLNNHLPLKEISEDDSQNREKKKVQFSRGQTHSKHFKIKGPKTKSEKEIKEIRNPKITEEKERNSKIIKSMKKIAFLKKSKSKSKSKEKENKPASFHSRKVMSKGKSQKFLEGRLKYL